MSYKFASLIFAFCLLFALSFVSSASIAGCGTITDDDLGQTLNLTADIDGWSGDFGECFEFSFLSPQDDNYLEIDCGGHYIDSNNSSQYLFYLDADLGNITLRNCDIVFDETSGAYSSAIFYTTNASIQDVNVFDSSIRQSTKNFFLMRDVTQDTFTANFLGSELAQAGDADLLYYDNGGSLGTFSIYNLDLVSESEDDNSTINMSSCMGDLNGVEFYDSNLDYSYDQAPLYGGCASEDSNLSFTFDNVDSNYLRFIDVNLNTEQEEDFITIINDSDLSYVYFENSEFNYNDTGNLIYFENISAEYFILFDFDQANITLSGGSTLIKPGPNVSIDELYLDNANLEFTAGNSNMLYWVSDDASATDELYLRDLNVIFDQTMYPMIYRNSTDGGSENFITAEGCTFEFEEDAIFYENSWDEDDIDTQLGFDFVDSTINELNLDDLNARLTTGDYFLDINNSSITEIVLISSDMDLSEQFIRLTDGSDVNLVNIGGSNLEFAEDTIFYRNESDDETQDESLVFYIDSSTINELNIDDLNLDASAENHFLDVYDSNIQSISLLSAHIDTEPFMEFLGLIHVVGLSDLNNINIENSDVNITSWSLFHMNDVSDSALYFDFEGSTVTLDNSANVINNQASDINYLNVSNGYFELAAFSNARLYTSSGNDSQVGELSLDSLTVDSGAFESLIYSLDSRSDVNYIRINNSDIELAETAFYDASYFDENLQIEFVDSNINFLIFSDFNIQQTSEFNRFLTLDNTDVSGYLYFGSSDFNIGAGMLLYSLGSEGTLDVEFDSTEVYTEEGSPEIFLIASANYEDVIFSGLNYTGDGTLRLFELYDSNVETFSLTNTYDTTDIDINNGTLFQIYGGSVEDINIQLDNADLNLINSDAFYIGEVVGTTDINNINIYDFNMVDDLSTGNLFYLTGDTSIGTITFDTETALIFSGVSSNNVVNISSYNGSSDSITFDFVNTELAVTTAGNVITHQNSSIASININNGIYEVSNTAFFYWGRGTTSTDIYLSDVVLTANTNASFALIVNGAASSDTNYISVENSELTLIGDTRFYRFVDDELDENLQIELVDSNITSLNFEDLNVTVLTTNFLEMDNSDISYLSVTSSDINLASVNDFINIYRHDGPLEVSLSDTYIHTENSDPNLFNIIWSEIPELVITDLNYLGSSESEDIQIFRLNSGEISNLHLENSNIGLDGGKLIWAAGDSGSDLNVYLADAELDLNNANLFYDSGNLTLDNLRIYDANVNLSYGNVFYFNGAPNLDVLFDSDETILLDSNANMIKIENTVFGSPPELAFDFAGSQIEFGNGTFADFVELNNTNLASLTIEDVNLIDFNSWGSIVYYASASDVDEINLGFTNEVVINELGSILYIPGSINTVGDLVLNLNDAPYSFISQAMPFVILSDINEITINDLNVLEYNGSIDGFFRIAADLNYFNYSSSNTITLESEDENFIYYIPSGTNTLFNFNDSDVNVENMFCLKKVRDSNIVVTGLNVIDSNKIILSIDQGGYAPGTIDLNLYGNTLRFNHLIDSNVPLSGTIYNNVLTDANLDNNNILLMDGITDENVVIDFNIAQAQNDSLRTLILTDDSSYVGGNYWLDENGEEICTIDASAPLGICEGLVLVNPESRLWVDYLPLAYYDAPGGDGDGDGDGDGGSGGGGGSSVPALSTTTPLEFTINEGKDKDFSFNSATHTLTLDDVDFTLGTARITVASIPSSYTLKVGEFAKKDLDGDGTYDVKVTLSQIINATSAKFSLLQISEVIATGPTDEEKALEDANEGTGESTGEDGSTGVGEEGAGETTSGTDDSKGTTSGTEASAKNTWVLPVVIIVVLAVILLFYFGSKKPVPKVKKEAPKQEAPVQKQAVKPKSK